MTYAVSVAGWDAWGAAFTCTIHGCFVGVLEGCTAMEKKQEVLVVVVEVEGEVEDAGERVRTMGF